jgi:hypothetical protein
MRELSNRAATTCGVAALLIGLLNLPAAASTPADDPARGNPAIAAAAVAGEAAREGIWKAAVPLPGSMHGQFENNDPVGLAAGVKVAADCSINWTDPDSHALYCFSSATSLVFFRDAPHAFLERASRNWLRLNRASN